MIKIYMARQILCFLTKEMRRLANKELIKRRWRKTKGENMRILTKKSWQKEDKKEESLPTKIKINKQIEKIRIL